MDILDEMNTKIRKVEDQIREIEEEKKKLIGFYTFYLDFI